MTEITPSTKNISPEEEKFNALYEFLNSPEGYPIKSSTQRAFTATQRLYEFYSAIKKPSQQFMQDFPEKLEKIAVELGQFNQSPDYVLKLVDHHVNEHKGDTTVVARSLLNGAAFEDRHDYIRTGNAFAFFNKSVALNEGKLNKHSALYLARTFADQPAERQNSKDYAALKKTYVTKKNKPVIAQAYFDLFKERTSFSPRTSLFTDQIPVHLIKEAVELGLKDSQTAVNKGFDLILKSDKSSEYSVEKHYDFIEWAQEEKLLEQQTVLARLKAKIKKLTLMRPDSDNIFYPGTNAAAAIHYVSTFEPEILEEHRQFLTDTIPSNSRGVDLQMSTNVDPTHDRYAIIKRLSNGKIPEKWSRNRGENIATDYKVQAARTVAAAVNANPRYRFIDSHAAAVVKLGVPDTTDKMVKFLESRMNDRDKESDQTLVALIAGGFVSNANEVLDRHPNNRCVIAYRKEKQQKDKLNEFGL